MTANFPNKHLVRQYTQDRAKSKEPPPSPDEIRRKLGWGLVQGKWESEQQQTTRGI